MLFWIAFTFVAFNFYGHILILFLLKTFLPLPLPERKLQNAGDKKKKLTVLVPVWNEKNFLRRKVENLLAQDISRVSLQIILCDGGSSDGSLDSIKDLLGERVRVLQCPSQGKILQLNYGLKHCADADFIAVSDADSFLVGNEGIQKAVDYLEDDSVGVVGAWTMPSSKTALPSEQAYWDKQNRMRYLETVACTASIVTAQFYAFRSGFIERLPEDCVADDVYVAFHSHSQNLRVIYAHDIEAIEERQARNSNELFWQKFRKAHAYTTELLRILHRLPFLSKRRKYFHLFKMFQFFYLPWAMLAFFAGCLQKMWQGNWFSLSLGLSALLFGTLAASFLVHPPPRKTRGGIRPIAAIQTIEVFVLVNIVLLLNSILFPFWRQSSNYRRVSK